MFTAETVAAQAIFRGGTAVHKLFLSSRRRYSGDIDLFQRTSRRDLFDLSAFDFEVAWEAVEGV